MAALEGMSAIVTGGGSGIGRGIVERFVAEGASVVAVDRVRDRVAELESKYPGRVVGVEANVASYEDNARAVAEAVRAFGKLDVFVGNAGIWDFGTGMSAMEPDKLSAAFDELYGVNVKGYLLGAKASLPELQKTQGNIIFTTSNAGWWPGGGGPIYVSSKHAVIGLIEQLALELYPIRVNGVAPGGTITDLRGLEALGMRERSFGDQIRSRPEMLAAFTPPEEHAPAYVFLASKEGRHSNAMVLDSTDGFLIGTFRRSRMGQQQAQPATERPS